MVKKGLCSYTQKVRNIEEAGGHVAIIVNDNDDKVEEMFLADDGHEGDLSIPAILISRIDGEKIINYYMMHKENKEQLKGIIFEIKFDIENKNNIVKYDIWYTPDLENVYTFMNDFQKYQKALGELAKMEPHFVTYPHFMYDPNSNTPKDDCLGSGLYCIRPGKLGITDGRLISIESIKQKCIYNITLNNKNPDMFWKYMSVFYQNCISKENFNEDCSNSVIIGIGLNLNEIKECLTQSFVGTTYDKQQDEYYKILKNSILDREYQLRKEYLISRVPSITINGRSYIGSWKPEFVFEALCAALIKKPEACYVEGNFLMDAKGFSFASSCMIIMLVLFINIILYLICKKYIRDKISERISSTDINTRIDTVVNSYVALREAK